MAAHNLERLFRPKDIAVYGGQWSDYVVEQCRKLGFPGRIWRVHPNREGCFSSTDALPGSPDCVFLGINRELTVNEFPHLRDIDAGGAVVFASGFNEASDGKSLACELDRAAGDIPYIGPNCYGFANFFDRVALWPDQAVGKPVDRGIAILGQSGTVCLSLMYQRRSLPIGYVISMGNQQRLAAEDLIRFVADDDRVSAIGMYLEGIRNLAAFVDAVEYARSRNKPIALVKVGRSDKSRATALTHTGALTGSDTLHDALFKRLGIARCENLGALVETLKLFHCHGPLPPGGLAVMGASGGDMSMVADASRHFNIEFSPPPEAEHEELEATTGAGVSIDNPFDFHTYTWFDTEKMRRMFGAMLRSNYALAAFMLDPPDENHADPTSYETGIEAMLQASRENPGNGAIVSSLPESLSAHNREKCLEAGVAPIQGLPEFLEAFSHASSTGQAWRNWNPPVIRSPSGTGVTVRTLDEDAGKCLLEEYGFTAPCRRQVTIGEAATAADEIGYPVALKAVAPGLIHKTELGGVLLNLDSAKAVHDAAASMQAITDTVLVESMTTDGVCELILGIVIDEQFGPCITLGAGGIMAELLRDTTTLLLPFTEQDALQALDGLRVARQMLGWRGAPPGDRAAVADALMRLARFAEQNHDNLAELDINPLIVRPAGRGVIVADTLIRLKEP